VRWSRRSVRSVWPAAWVAIPAGILTGSLIGFINGVLIAIIRVPAFIVTLAGSIAYSGLLLFLMFGQTTLIIRNDFYIALAAQT